VVASAAVLGAVVAGMVALGPPAEQRARRLDERRIEDLRALARGVEHVWATEQRLPPSLDRLPDGFARSTADPATGQPYEYSVRGEKGYQLCAVFERDNTEEPDRSWPRYDHVTMSIWTHGAGRDCFELEPAERERR
jgi:hypothetical protein